MNAARTGPDPQKEKAAPAGGLQFQSLKFNFQRDNSYKTSLCYATSRLAIVDTGLVVKLVVTAYAARAFVLEGLAGTAERCRSRRPSVIGGIPKPEARSTERRNRDNDAGKQIARTRQVWQPRLARDLSDEDVRQITHNMTSYFDALADWWRAERLAAANDAAAPAEPNEGQVRRDR